MNEEEVVQRLKNRDNNCFEDVVNQYKKKVISLCYSYTQDYYEAEDLSQEVFVTLYKSINNFKEQCSLSTYIYKIAVSRALDYKRKKSIKGFLTGLFNVNKEQNEIDIDEKAYIRQCIANLPKDLKVPIVLYYYIGLTQKEIAEVVDISPKSVEGRIYRAKQKLKLELEKEGTLLCNKNGMI